MVSKGLWLSTTSAALATSPPQPHIGIDPAGRGIFAVGLCVLAIWIARRLASPKRLALGGTPARHNNLTPGHILLILAAYLTAPLVAQIAFGQPLGYRWALLATMAAQVICLAVSLLVAKLTFPLGLKRGLGLSIRHWVCDTGRAVVGYLTVVPICLALYWIAGWLFGRTEADIHPLLGLLTTAGTIWKIAIVVSAVVLAPLAEEVFLRGLVQSMLRRYLRSPWLAILISSACFAALHPGQVKDMPALAALGIALGYNYERCGRLLPAIVLHAIFNGVSIITFISAAGTTP